MVWRETYIRKIRPFIGTQIVKVITGIRRCGKSVLLDLMRDELLSSGVSEDHILFMNFESLTDPRVKSFDSVIQSIRTLRDASALRIYLLFDEIQELAGWEKLVNSIMIDFDVDIYLTRSNAAMLSGELSKYLAGRFVEIKMHPFSFSDISIIAAQRVFYILLHVKT